VPCNGLRLMLVAKHHVHASHLLPLLLLLLLLL
jgi:hypothetical protein